MPVAVVLPPVAVPVGFPLIPDDILDLVFVHSVLEVVSEVDPGIDTVEVLWAADSVEVIVEIHGNVVMLVIVSTADVVEVTGAVIVTTCVAVSPFGIVLV